MSDTLEFPARRPAPTMSLWRILVALTVAATILGGAHYYVWIRLVRDPALPRPWSAVASWGLVVLVGMTVAGFALMRAPRSVSAPVMWVVYTWLGLLSFLVVILGAGDLLRLFASVARLTASWSSLGVERADPERRLLLMRVFGSLVGASALGLGGFGLFKGLQPVAVKRVEVRLPRLPSGMNGYRIVQLTDVHVGPTIGKEFIEELVAKVNALSPDLVAITGDLVDGSVAHLGPLVRPLANLRAKDGVYFVTGNHEYYSGADDWIRFLGDLGVRVLRNERVAIGGSTGFDLAGIDDPSGASYGRGHGSDLARAVRGRDRTRPLVLLAHQPRGIDLAERLGVDLQLSGHTHGGQLYPFTWLVKMVYPFLAGLYRQGAMQVYVSEGTGYWGPPMRVGTASEITHIELYPA